MHTIVLYKVVIETDFINVAYRRRVDSDIEKLVSIKIKFKSEDILLYKSNIQEDNIFFL